ncbi:MAG: methyltransferase domain-containing protein [Deltaproteobacteria bacterium]|nr:methyltransferase domain-containing protein [Deltaproteobacteria bacterium]
MVIPFRPRWFRGLAIAFVRARQLPARYIYGMDEREEQRRRWADDARERFSALYERFPGWEVGRPQPAIVALHEAGDIGERVLDAGCGTGENALFMAAHGHQVWGIDIVDAAIGAAAEKARQRGLPAARFLVADALALDRLGLSFDTVVDSGLLHAMTDAEQRLYLGQVRAVLGPGGSFYALCYSEHQPGASGPRRVRESELEALFASGWSGLTIVETRFVVSFSDREAAAYLVGARRCP